VIQTGDGLEIEYSAEAVTEDVTVEGAEEDDGKDANPTAINRTVDTVDLQLSAGQNLVSIPAETGTVSLSDLNTDHVETVYAWDDGSWTGYAPGDTTSDLQNLEGGQGYVFVMSAADEIPVQAYNKPGETGNGPAPLTDENIETGWNLIGHYQEANQDRDVALTELSGSYDASNVLGEQTDGDFGPVTQLRPGEGYWLYASQSDNYARSPFAGPVVSSLQVVEGDGSTNLETEADETVDISVEVTDVDGVDTVTADLSNLNGASDVTLSDSNNDDVYTTTKTLDLSGVTVGSQSVSVTATDAAADSTSSSVNVEVVATGDLADGGSSSVGSTEVEAGESTSQTLTLDVDGLSADGNTDTVTVTLTGASTVSSPGVSIDGSSAGSIEGSANVQKTNEITFDVSADGSGTYDGTFTVTATATYDAAGMSHDQTYSVTDSDGDTLNSVVLTGSVADTTGSDLKSTNTQTGSATGVIDVQATASDNEGGDIYYVVVADGDPSPTASDIKSGSAATGGSLQDSGSFTDVSAGTQTAGQTVGSLGGGTAVDVYYVQVDDAGNAGSPVSDDVTAGTA